MPRYVVQRTFPDGLHIRSTKTALSSARGDRAQRRAGRHLDQLVRQHGNSRMFCVYDAPTAGAICKSANRNELPVDEITQVRVLDPYF